jgi:hypothetical protein
MMTGIFARLSGCLCILALGVMASHAEPNANVLVCRNIELSRGIIGRGEDYVTHDGSPAHHGSPSLSGLINARLTESTTMIIYLVADSKSSTVPPRPLGLKPRVIC